MINSMTGYATATLNQNGQALCLDLRCVNSRYLEWHFRAGDEFRALESAFRERAQQQITRGKLECRISLSAANSVGSDAQLNKVALQQLADLAQQISAQFTQAAPLSVAEVLRWPGVLGVASTWADLPVACTDLFNQALAALQLSRQAEGEKLAAHIVERLDAMQAQIVQIQPHLPAIMSAYQLKIKQRYTELLGNTEDERIAQEVALFAQKIDVDEELSRLQMHILAVRDMLKKGGVVGKRLDFMMQELNREANTLGSKSVSVVTTQVAMELKVLIEQMREQIQNIE
ncbi:MAG: YicC/YloC family endoribonuclease [Sulfuriferula sp.]